MTFAAAAGHTENISFLSVWGMGSGEFVHVVLLYQLALNNPFPRGELFCTAFLLGGCAEKHHDAILQARCIVSCGAWKIISLPDKQPAVLAIKEPRFSPAGKTRKK